jgi:hypothetical protein
VGVREGREKERARGRKVGAVQMRCPLSLKGVRRGGCFVGFLDTSNRPFGPRDTVLLPKKDTNITI